MALSKYKLGELIELRDERNSDGKFTLEDVKGISIQKKFIETKADMQDVSLSPYILVKPDYFAYVTVTSRNGEKITLAHNVTNQTYIVSSSYVVFQVSRPDLLLSDYLFMYFNRPEFDRYARFNSWGSARETFDWDTMCDIDILLPDLPTQQKYVDIYKAMVANQQSYERGLEDLKLVCDAYIEDLRRKMPSEKIGKYITECNERNENELYGSNNIRGISINKEFIPTKADINGVSLNNYKIVKQNYFAFNPNTARMGEKICVALNKNNEEFLVSAIYPVFIIIDHNILLPEYLMLWIKREEFDRYVRFNSWGSARETFNFIDMQEVAIPIPEISIQKSIVDIYNVYIKRKQINEQLKTQIKDICPILVRGSLKEGE